MDTDVILILDNKDQKITLTGKTNNVVTESDPQFQEYYSDDYYGGAFPKQYLSNLDIRTTVNWQFDDGKSYTMKVEDKSVVKKEKHDIVTVSFYDLEDEVFEAQNKDTLHVVVKDGILNINAKDNYGNTRLFGAVKDWLSFKHERI